jgi:hypothetical protein
MRFSQDLVARVYSFSTPRHTVQDSSDSQTSITVASLDSRLEDVDTVTIVVRPTRNKVPVEPVSGGITVSQDPVDSSGSGVEGELSDRVDKLVEQLGIGDRVRSGAVSSIQTAGSPGHVRLVIGAVELSVTALPEVDLHPHGIAGNFEERVPLVVPRVT